jgi:putative membrane protein
MRNAAPLVALAAAAVLTAGSALAAVSAADKTFATEAAQGGMAEVQLGQLAVQKASSPQVKEFAQRMVTDHGQANQELMQIAKQQGVVLPTQVDSKHRNDMDTLRGLNGPQFDAAYMRHMLQDHQKDISDFQKQAQSGSDPALKAFAQKQLPILQQHMQMAQAAAPKG